MVRGARPACRPAAAWRAPERRPACAGFTTKLSSAGLIYKHFGLEAVASMMQLPPEHPDVQTVYLKVYKGFMEALDAIDNGAGHSAVLLAGSRQR